MALVFTLLSVLFLAAIWYWQNPQQSPFQSWFVKKGQALIIQKTLEEAKQSTLTKTDNIDKATTTNSIDKIDVETPEPSYSDTVDEPSVFVIKPFEFNDNNHLIEPVGDGLAIVKSTSQSVDLPLQLYDQQEVNKELIKDNLINSFEESETSTETQGTETPEPSVTEVDNVSNEVIEDASLDVNPQEALALQNTPIVNDANSLTFLVKGESWMDVSDATGEKLIYRLSTPGQTIVLQGQPPFSLFIGNVEGISLNYLGEDVDLASHAKGLVARLVVGEDTQ